MTPVNEEEELKVSPKTRATSFIYSSGDVYELNAVRNVTPDNPKLRTPQTREQFINTASSINEQQIIARRQRTAVSGFLNKSPEQKAITPGVTTIETPTGKEYNFTSEFFEDRKERIYKVEGEIFFASAANFIDAFDFSEILDKVKIDVSRSHFWDISAVGALDKVVLKFRERGVEVSLHGVSEASAHMLDRFAQHDKQGAVVAAH
mgnify:CR=1 FL=1